MSTALAPTEQTTAMVAVERAMVMGDLAKLTADERVSYYRRTCESLGLNYYTRPFDYLTLNNKLTLYALKGATDQLRALNRVSIYRMDRETTADGLHIVTAYARDHTGREDQDVGAVQTAGLKGEALANAVMKATTKAKRRVTLSICGLGWLDESEVDAIPGSRVGGVDLETGEIHRPAGAPVLSAEQVNPRPIAHQQAAPSPVRQSLVAAIKRALDDGWTQVEIQTAMANLWGVQSTHELTDDQRSELIALLAGRLALSQTDDRWCLIEPVAEEAQS